MLFTGPVRYKQDRQYYAAFRLVQLPQLAWARRKRTNPNARLRHWSCHRFVDLVLREKLPKNLAPWGRYKSLFQI